MQKQDCIVIGGGIIGMSTARELALRGLTVAIFDHGKLGLESSSVAGGILSSMRPWAEHPYSSELSATSQTCYQTFAMQLQQQTSIDPEYNRCGLLLIKQEDISCSKQWLSDKKIPFTVDYQNLPHSLQAPNNSIFLPHIAQIRVPKLLKALHANLLQLGVIIFEDTPISNLDIKNGTCISAQSETQQYYADSFVVTAGTWSQKLLHEYHKAIDISPVLGQMLCVKLPKQQLQFIVLDGERYMIPRNDGHVLIGSTLEHVGFKKRVTEQAKQDLMQWASTVWADITQAKFVQHWSGLRPYAKNGHPYLGKLNDYSNLYINAGHYRKGILQAPICAQKIAQIIMEQSK